MNDFEFEIKLKCAGSPEELLELAKSKGYTLSDKELSSVTDPTDWSSCPLYDDRPCPDHFYCIRH